MATRQPKNSNDSTSERTSLLLKPVTENFCSTTSPSYYSASTSTSTSTSTCASTSVSLSCSEASSSSPSSSLVLPMATGTGTATGTTSNPTNYSSNILMVYRLQEMQTSATINLWLALLCLVYLGINISLICVNYINVEFSKKEQLQLHLELQQQQYDEADMAAAIQAAIDAGEPVDDTVYHLVEFWATFGFAIVECIALANTPKSLYTINGDRNPLFLRMIMFFNIVATSVPAVMISFSLETFEILSHEIEYTNELTMSFIDVILLLSLWKSRTTPFSTHGIKYKSVAATTKAKNDISSSLPSSKARSSNSSNNDIGSNNDINNISAWATSSIALLVAVVQLGVYNLMGYNQETGDMVGEPLGHFLEFAFEIISSLIAFWFCMDNKYIADKEIGLILYGKRHDEECQICEDKAGEFALEHNGNNNKSGNIAAAAMKRPMGECFPCTNSLISQQQSQKATADAASSCYQTV